MLHKLPKRERKQLLNWILLFFDGQFPYLFRILSNGSYFKDKAKSDVGHVFMKMGAYNHQKPITFAVQCLLPDEPVIYELFITGLAVMLRMEKKEVVKSMFQYFKELRKYAPLADVTERTLAIVAENLLDEYDVYAIKQDPEAVINIYMNYLKSNSPILNLPEEFYENKYESLVKHIPHFLKDKQ